MRAARRHRRRSPGGHHRTLAGERRPDAACRDRARRRGASRALDARARRRRERRTRFLRRDHRRMGRGARASRVRDRGAVENDRRALRSSAGRARLDGREPRVKRPCDLVRRRTDSTRAGQRTADCVRWKLRRRPRRRWMRHGHRAGVASAIHARLRQRRRGACCAGHRTATCAGAARGAPPLARVSRAGRAGCPEPGTARPPDWFV